MSYIDWIILIATLSGIVLLGIFNSKGQNNTEAYLKGTHQFPWYSICLSIMATQASAITFISLPGQAFDDGMRFIQIYFGLPIAMVIISITFVPLFHHMKVYTAYEFLEKRFDGKTRSLTAILFLLQRGLTTGISMYAPALVLSVILGWNTLVTNIIIGVLVSIYTISGGSKSVGFTHHYQMLLVLAVMAFVGVFIVYLLPEKIGFVESLTLAGKLGKLNAVDLSFDPTSKYNIWTGVIGGVFLSLSYFGTDQSQVARYISGSSIKESRMGLLLNGFVKIPMQFGILLIGVLVYVFYIFNSGPLFYNPIEEKAINKSSYAAEFKAKEMEFKEARNQREEAAFKIATGNYTKDQLIEYKESDNQIKQLRKDVSKIAKARSPLLSNENDTNYIFLRFVTTHLPTGLIGLLIAVIFSASMSSMASGLSSLASATVVDVYKKSIVKEKSDAHYLKASRVSTLIWGVVCVGFAELAGNLGSLIEVVNVMGSLFYGTVLGVFIAAFYFKKLKGTPVFIAAILTEAIVFYCYYFTKIPYLWYNAIGCILVITISWMVQALIKQPKKVLE
ncbi:MAG: sodium:solute symporter [Bacteroidota bacterium]|nr:sodium:solute symporter [Bacteroidota bacterium]